MKHFDFIIIGTGMGGGTLAYALRNSGAKVLLLERGDFLPLEPQKQLPLYVVSDIFSPKSNRSEERDLNILIS